MTTQAEVFAAINAHLAGNGPDPQPIIDAYLAGLANPTGNVGDPPAPAPTPGPLNLLSNPIVLLGALYLLLRR